MNVKTQANFLLIYNMREQGKINCSVVVSAFFHATFTYDYV